LNDICRQPTTSPKDEFGIVFQSSLFAPIHW
jgi:hypothetical protein